MRIPKLQIVERPVASLRPYKGNARRHPRAQITKLKASVSTFGFVNPIIIDETGMVLCGAGRLEAAIALGLETVPTVVLSHMSEADKRAYILADNRIAAESSFSRAMLRQELSGLLELGYELELTAFDAIEIDSILATEIEPEDDDVHLPLETSIVAIVSRLGDRWVIGGSALVVGDARDPAAYELLLEGARAELIFTDPPYGCKIEGNVSGLGQVKHGNFVMGAGEVSLPEFAMTLLRPAFKQMVAHAKSGAIAFVCTDWRAAPHMLDAGQGVFEELKNWIVWAKTNAGMGTFYRSQHEFVLAFKASAGKHINNFGLGKGGRHRGNLWTYAGANTFRAGRMEDLAVHSTVKPKKMVKDALLDCSIRGGIVLDPFAGSGTTLVAAEETGRRGFGIELDPKYADVILQRVSEAAGVSAMLGNETFEQVKARRALENDGEGGRG